MKLIRVSNEARRFDLGVTQSIYVMVPDCWRQQDEKDSIFALTVLGGKANICSGFIDLWVI